MNRIERRTEGRRLGLWLAAPFGFAAIAFGAHNLVRAFTSERVREVAGWIVGADLVHDLLLAPVVALVGGVLVRAVPTSVRRPLLAALFATGIVIAVGWPALRGYGRATVPDNPTVQPLHYGTAVATVVATVWLACATWWMLGRWRARRARAMR